MFSHKTFKVINIIGDKHFAGHNMFGKLIPQMGTIETEVRNARVRQKSGVAGESDWDTGATDKTEVGQIWELEEKEGLVMAVAEGKLEGECSQ